MLQNYSVFKNKNLSKKEKTKGFIYILLGIIQTILDLLAFSLIIPVVIFLLKGNILDLDNKYLNFIYSVISDYLNNIPKLFFIIFFAFSIKYLFSLFIHFFQIKYSNDLISSTRSKLLSKYLNLDYIKIFDMKSSIITNGIILNAERAIEIFYINSLILIQSVLHVSIFVIFLSTINLNITVFISLISTFFLFLYYFIIRKKLNNFGIKKYEYNSTFVKNIQEIYNGFHIIKLFKLEKKIYNLFRIKAFNYGRVNTIYKLLINFPKVSKEIILFMLLIILFFFLSFFNYSNNLIINYIAVFSIIGLRLFPQLILIFNTVGNIKHSEYSMKILNEELKKFEERKQKSFKEISINNNLEFKNISFSFNTSNKNIFNNLSFKISIGQIIGIAGENGSGKSTFLKMLSGLIKPTKGEILIDNNKLNNFHEFNWQNSISYAEQNVFLFNDTILNNITLEENKEYDKKKINEIIEGTNLKDFIDSQTDGLNKIIAENTSNISGGEKQKIAICRALYQNSKFILFDESLSNIDEKSVNIIKNYLKNIKDKGIVIISHKKDILSMCDNVYKLQDKHFLN